MLGGMARRGMLWGGLVAASVVIAAVAITAAMTDLSSPERPVRDYLAALAVDDLTTAARLAGLDAGDLEELDGMPLGDAGSPDVIEIVRVAESGPELRVVTARYGESGEDVVEVAFALVPERLGPFTRWVMREPPIEQAVVRADRHGVVTVNGERLEASEPGAPVTVTAFVPARLEAVVDDPFLESAGMHGRLGAEPVPLTVEVRPSVRLERAVANEVAAFLDDCVAQRVLQPAACPFGVVVPDRLLEKPRWHVSVPPVIAVLPGEGAGVWLVEGGATVRVELSVQRLIDGVVEERDEAVVASIRGTVVLGDAGPRLTIEGPVG